MGAFDVSHNQLTGTLPAAYMHTELKLDPFKSPVTFWDFSVLGERICCGHCRCCWRQCHMIDLSCTE